MKLHELVEGFDKSHANTIVWRESKTFNGFIGIFGISDLLFVIEIQIESIDDLEQQFKISLDQDIQDLLINKTIIRVDYSQLYNGEVRYDNTHNVGIDALKVLSTVILEVGNKLSTFDNVHFIYFSAKTFSENEKNQRMTLYPKIGKALAKRLNMAHYVIKSSNLTVTILAKGLSSAEFMILNQQFA